MRHICFDVLGTCFGFQNMAEALDKEFGRQFKQSQTNAMVVAMLWYYSTKRDFAFLSTMGQYTPIPKVFRSTLKRTLLISFETLPDVRIEEEQIDRITAVLKQMEPRKGLAEAMQQLESMENTRCYGVTNGGKESSCNLFKSASTSLPLKISQASNIFSCDDIQTAKPDLKVYDHVLSKIKPAPSDELWFVAAHSWDLAAAKKRGFKTVWLDFEEHDEASSIYGKADISIKEFSELVQALETHKNI